jgi:5-methylcytosine-specific restriction enzyme subunit McrC
VISSSSADLYEGRQIQIRNIWFLLLYAWDMAAWRGRWSGAVENSPSLFGLLARILAASTRELLHYQLGRSYCDQSRTIAGLRGRVHFARSLKQRTFERGAAHCCFSELNVDSLKNRILKFTLQRLATEPRLRHGKPDEEVNLRHELRSVVRQLELVTLTQITPADFSRLQLSRNDQRYILPLSICAMVLRLEMPTDVTGDQALAALLRDEITFHRLFENFVRNFYKLHLVEYRVESERLDWHEELGSEFLPIMQTDVTLTRRAPPCRRLVIDTKYSIRTLSDRGSFKSDNLYQIYAYLRTQEHRSAAHLDAEGMLLYPTTTQDLDENILVQGHRIRIATVNLSAHWEEIESRLLALIAQ